MSDVEITIKLPEELLEQARADGVPITDASIASLIEAELIRAQAAKRRREAMQRLQGSLSLEEIEEELARAKAERIAAHKSKKNLLILSVYENIPILNVDQFLQRLSTE